MKNYIIICVLVLFVSCQSDNKTTYSLQDDFYELYYQQNILPALTNFKAAMEEEVKEIKVFKANINQGSLENIQTKWLHSAEAFSKLNTYSFVAVKTRFFHTNIYNFPVNTAIVENNIASQENFDTNYFSTASTVSKGLATLEYLMYDNQDDTLALTKLQEDTHRVNYLLGVAEAILGQTNSLIAFWEKGYKTEFINANEVGCEENARCVAFNQLINVIDVIRVTKIGKPAGLEKSESVNVEILEAFRSENSLKLIRASIEEIEYVYSGSSANFSDMVNGISGSEQLSLKIADTFKDVYKNIDGIDTSLFNAISNDDPKVQELYESLFQLLRYFSVDATSILSINVFPTDNDGD